MGSIQITIVIAYFALLTTLILYLRRSKTFEDFAVASRSIPGLIIFGTLSANFIGPGYTMGLTAKGFTDGYVWFFIFSAFSIQTLLVGLVIAPKLPKFTSAYTVGDVMGYYYGTLAKIITGIISVFFCAGIVAVVAKAGGLTFNVFTGI